MNKNHNLTSTDKHFLALCIDLAEEALNEGDKPFGSILVDKDGNILAQVFNKVNTVNVLAHPEFELAAWALNNLSKEQRQKSTMYTSGEHCPMCAGAQGMSDIGTVVYAASSRLYNEWLKEFNIPPSPINLLSIEEVVKDIIVRGPADGELLERIKKLHQKSNT